MPSGQGGPFTSKTLLAVSPSFYVSLAAASAMSCSVGVEERRLGLSPGVELISFHRDPADSMVWLIATVRLFDLSLTARPGFGLPPTAG